MIKEQHNAKNNNIKKNRKQMAIIINCNNKILRRFN